MDDKNSITSLVYLNSSRINDLNDELTDRFSNDVFICNNLLIRHHNGNIYIIIINSGLVISMSIMYLSLANFIFDKYYDNRYSSRINNDFPSYLCMLTSLMNFLNKSNNDTSTDRMIIHTNPADKMQNLVTRSINESNVSIMRSIALDGLGINLDHTIIYSQEEDYYL